MILEVYFKIKQHMGMLLSNMTFKMTFILFATFSLLVACTPTPNVEYDAQTAVPLSLVEDLQFSDTTDLDIAECKQRFDDIAAPDDVDEGDVLGADFVLYIDLDPVYLSWEQFSMEALCVKANWGVFRTTGVVEVPTVGQVWSIDPDG